MTITNTDRKVIYTGNAATTVWAYSFKIPDAASVAVLTEVIATGVTTVISSADYTITGLGNSVGGTLTYPKTGLPLAATMRIAIYRDVPVTQGITVSNQTAYDASVVETVWDRGRMIDQDMREDVNRSIKMPITYEGPVSTFPLPAPSQVVIGNSDGTGWNTVDINNYVSIAGSGLTSERSIDNAMLGSALGLGKAFAMAGYFYLNETGGTACSDLGVPDVTVYGVGSPYHFGVVLDGDLDVAVTSATDDSAAFARFWLWLASGNGHTAHLPEGKTARCDSKAPSLSGTYTLTGGPFTFDQRNLPNANGDPVGGSVLPHSGAVAETVVISSITPVVDGNGKEIVTVVTGAAHGLAVGDDILLSSSDLVDIGYNSYETRGQMSRVRSVTNTTTFIIEEQLFQTLPTNPLLTKYNWVEDIRWDADVTFYGPGRRAGANTNNLEISYNGPSFTFGRNIQINNLTTKFIDYQSIVFDNCIDYGTDGCSGEVTRVDDPNITGAIQYFLTDKNACTRGHHNNFTSVGYRHAYDNTAGNNPGVGRDILIENYNIVGTWRSAIDMHGNAINCRVGSGKIYNCYDGIGVRAPGWTISGKIEMERVRSMVLLSDNAFATQIRGLRGKDVRRVVALADTNIMIGIPEFGELDVADVSVDGCALNAIDINSTSIPIFTEADSAALSGTTQEMVTGDLNLYTMVLTGTNYRDDLTISPFVTLVQAATGATAYVSNVSGSTLILQRVTGVFNETTQLSIVALPSDLPLGAASVPTVPIVAITNYNNSGMLTGAELTVDPDGGGVGVEVIRTVTQVYDAGLNTNTFTWPTAIGTAVNTNATYHLRTLIDGVKIADINIRNGLGRAVQLAGNFRSPVIRDIDDNSDSTGSLAPVWLRAVGENFTRSADLRGIITRNRVGPQIDAANTGTRIDGDFADRATAVEYLSDGFIADGEHFFAGDLAFVGSAGATEIADMDGVVPDDATSAHFGLAGTAWLGADTKLQERVAAPAISGLAPAGWTLNGGVLRDIITVSIGTGEDFATIQGAVDAISTLTFAGDGKCILSYADGHVPTTGLIVPEGADWGSFWIKSAAANDTVTIGAGGYPADDAFIRGQSCVFPTLDCIIDCDGQIDKGMHSVQLGKFWIRPTMGIINALVNNLELRSSRGDINGAVFNGAGRVGVRTQQASNLRAQDATADNCGVRGFDVSRASTANLMYVSAQNCGALAGVGDEVNQGGIVVRRSLVAATEANVSGSTFGISAQLSALVEAGGVVATNCTIAGIRASSMSRIQASTGDFTNSVIGVTAGFGATIRASSGTWTGTTTSHVLFGTSADIDVSGPTGTLTQGGNDVHPNSPSQLGTIWADDPAANLGTKAYSFFIADDGVASFDISGSGTHRAMVLAIAFPSILNCGTVYCRLTNAQSSVLSGGADLAVSTGVLTGTTGTDGKVTVSPHSDGKIYIENRSGTGQNVGVTILSQNTL
jgi:hypothetical protein